MTLDQLTIEDGQIALEDQKAGKPRDVYEHIDLDLKGLGPDRRGSLTGNVRLDTMAAVLKIQSDFETGPAVSAKGNLTLTSDRSKDPLNVTYDVRRANATSPVIIQQLDAKIGSLSASATGSVNTQTTPSPLQIHANDRERAHRGSYAPRCPLRRETSGGSQDRWQPPGRRADHRHNR